MGSFNSLVDFFKDGGLFMYPIAIVMAVGFAIAIERLWVLTRVRSENRNMLERLLPLLSRRDFEGAAKLSRESEVPVARMISAGMARMTQTPRREEIEYAMEEGVLEAIPRLEKRTAYIATLANIATLLGLLGTIMGLIDAFSAVANAEPAKKAALLSSSISVAMNTTAFGLIVAIPLLLVYTNIQNKTTEIIDSLEMAGVKCLNLISGALTAASKARTADADPRVNPTQNK